MRVLIDECVDERLRFLLPDHDCQTARFANLTGLKNGRQQNLAARKLSLLILCGPTNRLRDLELLVPSALSALHSIGRGLVVRIK